MGQLPRIQPELVLSKKIPDEIFQYTERDVALYALGVGAAGDNAVDRLELEYCYQSEGQRSLKVLPTFAVLYLNRVMDLIDSIDGLHYDAKLLLHGEQSSEIYRPLPTRGQGMEFEALVFHDYLQKEGVWILKALVYIVNPGKAAIVEVEVLSRDAKTHDMLCLNRYTMFLRGAGGFSPSSKPFSYSKRTTHLPRTTPALKPSGVGQPEAAPDIVYDDQTRPSQALLYRLSGDYNPIHSDPLVAAQAGFKLPILHGLCTMGFAVRAIIRSCCNGDPTRVQSFQGRFLSHVFPGDKLTTEMWLDPAKSRVSYRTKADGRHVLVGTVLLLPPPRSLL